MHARLLNLSGCVAADGLKAFRTKKEHSAESSELVSEVGVQTKTFRAASIAFLDRAAANRQPLPSSLIDHPCQTEERKGECKTSFFDRKGGEKVNRTKWGRGRREAG